jgi:exopolysaccharide biosynthesis protein
MSEMMCFLSAQISSLLRDVLRYKHVKKTKNTRISNERERETILHKMTGKSSSREKKRTFLSLLSSKNNINIEKKSTVSWGPLWDSPTRIKKQKEEEEGRRKPNTISDFALTTPPNEPVAK